MDLEKMTESSWGSGDAPGGEELNNMTEAETTYKAEIPMDASLPGEEGAGAETEQPAAEASPEVPPETTEAEESPKEYFEKQNEVFQKLSDDKLNLAELYESEYLKNGDYSEATYKALEAKGLTKEYVDIISDAIKVKTEQYYDKVIESAGGAETYLAIQEWGKKNASDSELKRYNQAISEGDLSYVKLQLNAWKSQVVEVKGVQPTATLKGVQAQTSPQGAKPFESLEEQTKAINDPRFRNAGKYRNEVLARMVNSSFTY